MPDLFGQKNSLVRIGPEKIFSEVDGITRLSGHATALQNLLNGVTDGVKRLRQGGAAASESVTVTEQGATGFYDITFTPTVGSAVGELYLLEYQEPSGIAAVGRSLPYYVQVFDSISVTPLGGSYFTSLANLKEYLGDGQTGSDALYANLIARCTKEIQSYLNRVIFQNTYTAFRDGYGPLVQLAETPIVSVTTLHDSLDQTWDATTLVASTEYLIDKRLGHVRKLYGVPFLRAYQNVKTVYVGGYATVPEDIEQACIELAAMKFQAKHDLVTASVSIGDGSRTIQREPSLTAAMKSRLNAYLNDGLGDSVGAL